MYQCNNDVVKVPNLPIIIEDFKTLFRDPISNNVQILLEEKSRKSVFPSSFKGSNIEDHRPNRTASSVKSSFTSLKTEGLKHLVTKRISLREG